MSQNEISAKISQIDVKLDRVIELLEGIASKGLELPEALVALANDVDDVK